ncbi:MAG TPA: hypothetical protein VGG85_04155 [Terracidiphilus sp.]|jgi:hypothetical protein
MKKRQMILIPEVNPKSFVFFYEKGNGGSSWSIRDYSIRNWVKKYGPSDFLLSGDEIHDKARHSFDAPTHSTEDLAFWHKYTEECNRRYGVDVAIAPPRAQVEPVAEIPLTVKVVPPPDQNMPILNPEQLKESPKGRKAQDMERILHSPNSEDWVTWNFFQILRAQYPSGWFGHLVSAARRRNSDLNFPFDDRSLPAANLWVSVCSPPLYEARSRERMIASSIPGHVARARLADPVEGSSEIDIALEHDDFLLFIEAKLGSDISMNTSYDPARNQIARNIDCVIDKAEERVPMFWMMVRDEEPSRAYVQLMRSYKNEPHLLCRDLPHRDPGTLERLARNLTILRWSDFVELVCAPGPDAEMNAVKKEMARRMAG